MKVEGLIHGGVATDQHPPPLKLWRTGRRTQIEEKTMRLNAPIYAPRLRRPIAQGRGIEIRAVGPCQRVNLAIQHDLFKQAQVAQRPIKPALEDGAEINFPERAVVKANTQGIRPHNGKRRHFANSVPHNVITAAARWALAAVLAAATASLPSILLDAFRPTLPQDAAAEEEATPKSIRRDPSRKLPPPLDSKREDAADDVERMAPHTCG